MSEPDQTVSAPPDRAPVRWGIGDAAIGWIVAQGGGMLAFGLVMVLSGSTEAEFDDLSLWWLAVAQLGLWAGLLGIPIVATTFKGNGVVHDLGLRMKRVDPLVGLGVGIVTQLILIPLLYWPLFSIFDIDVERLEQPARELTDRASGPVGIALLVVIVGIVPPIVEEVFYRGLLQRALANRFGVWPGIVGSAVVFGASHFQLLQLPALVLLGVVLGYVTHRTGRLGPAIFAHLVFNMITVVVLVSA